MSARKCRFCGSVDNVHRVKKKFPACAVCRPALYAVINTPDVIEQSWPLFHDRAILPQVRQIRIPWKTEIPEELPARRYREEDRQKNQWYVVVSEYEDHPVEVFTSTASENLHELHGEISNLSALTRLISLMLRHIFFGEQITLVKIKKQLQRSSRKKRDLPDVILGVLDRYEKSKSIS
jgi:hypothetical protein